MLIPRPHSSAFIHINSGRRLLQESGRRAARHNPDRGGGDAGEQGGGAPPVLRQEARQDQLALVQERPLHRDLQVGLLGEQNMVQKVSYKNQCCGSGSGSVGLGSICFWASRIRIR